jgi:hypothetical protein
MTPMNSFIYLVPILAFTFLVLYGYWYKRKIKSGTERLSYRLSTIAKNLHYIGLALCVVVIVLNSYDFAFRGLWTTRIIIILTLFTGSLLYPLSDKKWRNSIEKYYLKVFSWVPFFFSGVLVIPFMGLLIMGSLFAQLANPGRVWYEDDNLVIKQRVSGVLGMAESAYVWRYQGLLRKHVYHLKYWDGAEKSSLRVTYTDSTATLSYYDETLQTIIIKK